MSDSDTVERKSAVGPEQGEQVTPASIGNSGGRQASARWSPFVAPSSSMNRQLFGDGTASMSIHPPGFPRFPGIWGGELGQSASHDTRQDYESVHPRVVARRTNDAGTCNDLSTESGILGSSNDERHKTAGDHVCEYCGRWCDKPSTLATHMNSHTGARPYYCPFDGCEWSWSVLTNSFRQSKIHFQSHHSSPVAVSEISKHRSAMAVSIAEIQARGSGTVIESNGLESDDGVP